MSTSAAPLQRRFGPLDRALLRFIEIAARNTKDAQLAKRSRLVAAGYFGVAHAAQIHYAERRPFPVQAAGKLPALPLTTDCSGFVAICFRAAGAPDPSRQGWNGQGYTGTLLRFGERVAVPQAGDVVVYGGGLGHHAALVLRGGEDPLTASHGSEVGPLLIRVSEERRYQPPGVTYLRFPV